MSEMIESPPTLPSPLSTGQVCGRLAIVLVIAAVALGLVIWHVHNVNGPWYHLWYWRRLSIWPLYPLMILAAVPFFVAQGVYQRTGRTRIALVMMTLGTVALQWAALSSQPHAPGRHRIEEIVENGVNTSYYSAAKVLLEQQAQGIPMREWMSLFPDLMEHFLMVHARFKPPGLILYYMGWTHLLGPTTATRLLAGGLVGAMGACGVLTTYWLIRFVTGHQRAAFFAASFFSLIPPIILFTPQFDQAYVPLASLAIIAWANALRTGKPFHAVAFGLLFAGVLFLSYAFLMLGAFLSIYSILYIGRHRLKGVQTILQQGVLAAATIVAAYLLLWLCLDFNAIEVYRTASRLSQADLVRLERTFPLHMIFDLLDVLLATGWISVPLFVGGFISLAGSRREAGSSFTFACLGLTQVVLSIGIAVFPGENARLLLFIMPLLMFPIGWELSRWRFGYRLAVFATLLVITVVVCQNMVFLVMPADQPVLPAH